MIKTGILTISDKGSRGQRRDDSGPAIREALPKENYQVASYEAIPDEADVIARKLTEWADGGLDLILTTGGTGLGPRDVTPEATLQVVERLVPGIAEAVRAASLVKTPFAMLSRAVAGVRGQCLIINLPGSPRAARECLEVIGPVIPHAVQIIQGEITEHNHTGD